MKKYYVVYTKGGKEKTQMVEADNPGKAFYFCKREHPESKLIRCYKEGWKSFMGSSFGYTEWGAPKNQNLPSFRQGRKQSTDQFTFPF